jgi:HK97 family phage major capsid protein
MRTPGLCTVIRTSSGTTDIPTVASRGAAAWDAESAAYEESDDVFGQVTLAARKMTRIIKVTDELLADSQFPLPAYLAGSFGKSFGDLEETAFVAGTGTTQPDGIVPGSTVGVVAAGQAAITADELFDLYHSPISGYRKNGTFMTADLTVKAVRKLKDGNGQYLWEPGLKVSQPSTLLGRPLLTAADMPAMTTGLRSVIFGDFSYYWIADRGVPVFKRLDELYAASGQVGFAGSRRVDGVLTIATAVYHLIQA